MNRADAGVGVPIAILKAPLAAEVGVLGALNVAGGLIVTRAAFGAPHGLRPMLGGGTPLEGGGNGPHRRNGGRPQRTGPRPAPHRFGPRRQEHRRASRMEEGCHGAK